MRHSAGDHAWRAGDIVRAQELLRHESIQTTRRYLHPDRRDLIDSLARLDEDWGA
jgi:integrase